MKKLNRIDIIKILAVVLAVQITLIVFLNLFSPQNLKSRKMARPLFENFKVDSVLSMTIQDSEQSFDLLKKGDRWFIKVGENNLPASSYKVEGYLKELETMNRGIVVSSEKDNEKLTGFGLDEKSRKTVTVTLDDGKEFKLKVGKTSSQKGNSYVIYKEENKIREVLSDVSNNTHSQYIKWANKILLSGITDSEVATCSINADFEWNSDSYTVKYQDSTSDSTNFVLDSYPVGTYNPFSLKTLVYGVVTMEIDEYKLDGRVDSPEQMGHVKLVLRNGKNYNIYFYRTPDLEPGRYIVKTDFTNFVYYVNEEKLKNIYKTLDAILVNPNPGE